MRKSFLLSKWPDVVSALDRKRKSRAKFALERAVLLYQSLGGDVLHEVHTVLAASRISGYMQPCDVDRGYVVVATH